MFEWFISRLIDFMVAITGSGNTSVKISGLEKGKKLHLVLKVNDNGKTQSDFI